MTVKELVEHLQTMPQDYLVVYRACSDCTKLEADDINVYSAEQKKVVQHHNMPDRVMDYSEWQYEPKGKLTNEPKFLDVVMFPGN